MASLRNLILDDTNPDIVYQGDWTPRFGTFETDRGRVFEGTMHQSTSDTATFSLEFEGQNIFVRGRVESRLVEGEVVNANFECHLDGQRRPRSRNFIEIPTDESHFQNEVELCRIEKVPPGKHTLSVRAGGSVDGPFMLDQITITPTRDMRNSERDVLVQPQDAGLVYLPNRAAWIEDPTPAKDFFYTTVPGATVLFDFVGTRLTWFAEQVPGQPASVGRALYSIDNGNPTPVDMQGLPEGETSPGNRVLFDIKGLELKKHRLNVTYVGGSNRAPGAPIVLDNLVLYDSQFIPNTLPQDEIPPPATTQTTTQASNPGAIAGGVVGGIAALLLIAFLVWFFQRRRNLKKDRWATSPDEAGVLSPFSEPRTHAPQYGGDLSTIQKHLSEGAISPTDPRIARFESEYPSHYGANDVNGPGVQSSAYVKNPRPLPQPLSLVQSMNSSPDVSAPPMVSEKARLRMASEQAENDTASIGSGGAPRSHVGSSLSYVTSNYQVVHHEDSGVRLPTLRPGQAIQVVDMPPSYSQM